MIAFALAIAVSIAAQDEIPPVRVRLSEFNDCVISTAREMEPSGEGAGDIADAAFAECEIEEFLLLLAVANRIAERDGEIMGNYDQSVRETNEITAPVRRRAVAEIVQIRAERASQ